MKTNCYKNHNLDQGSARVVPLTVLAMASLVLGSYLVMVQTQTNSVARSQTRSSAMAISEAGLKAGLAEINKNAAIVSPNPASTSAWGWTNNLESDGWSAFTKGQTTLTRSIVTDNAGADYYTVTIDISSGTPVITSAGTVAFTSALWGSYAGPQPFLAGVGANYVTNSVIGRKVHVQAVLSPLFTAALIIKSNLTMSGNGTTIDSYDSSNTNYSTAGQWVASKRKAGGNIATDSAIATLNVGNGNIYGQIYTGPGSLQSQVSVGANGAVGDANWNASSSGVEPGYWAGNFNQNIADVPAPTFVGWPLPPATNGYVTLLAGHNYTVAGSYSPSSPIFVAGPGAATLWVQGSFTPSGAGVVFTNGGSLIAYVGTTNTSNNDSFTCGSFNYPGYAANFQIFGLPSLTSITLSGNDTMVAAIYAPEAAFTGNGGGSSGLFEGSLIVQSITLNGHFNIHYDESLVTSGASRGWIAKNWTEVKY